VPKVGAAVIVITLWKMKKKKQNMLLGLDAKFDFGLNDFITSLQGG